MTCLFFYTHTHSHSFCNFLTKENDQLLVVENEQLLIEVYVITKMSCFDTYRPYIDQHMNTVYSLYLAQLAKSLRWYQVAWVQIPLTAGRGGIEGRRGYPMLCCIKPNWPPNEPDEKCLLLDSPYNPRKVQFYDIIFCWLFHLLDKEVLIIYLQYLSF